MKARIIKNNKFINNFIFYLLTILICIIPLIVFFWMFTAGLKTQADNTSIPPKIFFTPTFDNFREVFSQNKFMKYLLNSFIVAFFSVGVALVLGLPAAYVIAKYRMRKTGIIFLIARMVPFISYLIPWFIVLRYFKMIDTYLALITTHLIITLPFVIWIMINFFEGVPKSLEESARIDGCSYFQSFMRIVLPIVRNGIFTSSILSFIFSWNQFLFSLILSGSRTMTVPVAVFRFISYEEINWGGLAAAATIITVPPLIMTVFVQKYIISGLTAGAVKE
jgi:multiple sugar transport system permease protein